MGGADFTPVQEHRLLGWCLSFFTWCSGDVIGGCSVHGLRCSGKLNKTLKPCTVLGLPVQAQMQPARQSVEEVKAEVAAARYKAQPAKEQINGTFNEEDFMDGDLVEDMH